MGRPVHGTEDPLAVGTGSPSREGGSNKTRTIGHSAEALRDLEHGVQVVGMNPFQLRFHESLAFESS